jgi:hypothetical protein
MLSRYNIMGRRRRRDPGERRDIDKGRKSRGMEE